MGIIEWKNPPRGVLDEADDIAKELWDRPGEWALIGLGRRYPHAYLDRLRDNGVEYRMENERAFYEGRVERRVADLYARWTND